MVSVVVEASFADGVDDQSQFVVPLFPKFAHLKIESIIWNVYILGIRSKKLIIMKYLQKLQPDSLQL